ncbi:ABC transporter ATP-binding protein [Lactococcus fujiensis]|uniref:Oligopeptide transport ATP-binding protein AmiE n=1 Tax=Lactococcus fujiensis JCM 16395 TaxID=1291764 RepID=A0A2A5RNI9_9LACT|nr:ABC transporter ATP-binding protein [Lactococcus fujiensis]PCS00932.1 oligopeptide transport ATP-binding protein AmiE [Lactococcus fujiensis JCM 16395]
MTEKKKIIEAKNISVQFRVRNRYLTAIRDVSVDLYDGEVLAIVGESGSGKSVFTKTFTGMLEENGHISEGTILYNGQDLAQIKSNDEWAKIRGGEIATIFQDPMTSLNPILTIGKQIVEVIEKHQKIKGEKAKQIAIDLMKKVGIPEAEKRFSDYPFEYSGGMRQRIVIAIALACKPKILICDEPTTALDVTIQAQILDLIRTLQEEYQFTTIFITHDLGVVANIADKVAVMYAGEIVEYGSVEDLFFDPKHPYTWSLLSSLPQLGQKGEELFSIPGTPPSLFKKIKGDAFAPRNPFAMKVDYEVAPPKFQVTSSHWAKTWLLDERAPKIEKPEIIQNLHEKMQIVVKKQHQEEL